MLSNDAFKLLKWLEKNDKWMAKEEIAKGYKPFDDRSFKALATEKMVKSRLAEDGDNWAEYRIGDSGKAYLEGIRAQRLPELRDWINALLPIFTFLGGLVLSDPVKDFFCWLFKLLS